MPRISLPHYLKPYLPFIPTLALIAGLVFDIFTLNRPDAFFENAVIIGYLTLSAIAVVTLQSRTVARTEYYRIALLGVLQFSFGNLASALLILYTRSGTLVGSAIFLSMLAALFLGNEFLKNRYARAHLRVVIWFVLLLTYAALVVPIIVGSISVWTFLGSVAVALAIAAGLITLVQYVTPEDVTVRFKTMKLSVGAVAIVFMFLYFIHAIPPVPLALKHIGIYHHVTREGSVYLAEYEEPEWYAFWRDTNSTFHHRTGADAFCFSSVFAPPGLETNIRHRWEVYEAGTDSWRTVSRIPFGIAGGRDEGFRGYTQTGRLTAGTWRCNVETSRGVLIGRETFTVEETPEPVETINTRL